VLALFGGLCGRTWRSLAPLLNITVEVISTDVAVTFEGASKLSSTVKFTDIEVMICLNFANGRQGLEFIGRDLGWKY
jgi:hypothetical protein